MEITLAPVMFEIPSFYRRHIASACNPVIYPDHRTGLGAAGLLLLVPIQLRYWSQPKAQNLLKSLRRLISRAADRFERTTGSHDETAAEKASYVEFVIHHHS